MSSAESQQSVGGHLNLEVTGESLEFHTLCDPVSIWLIEVLPTSDDRSESCPSRMGGELCEHTFTLTEFPSVGLL